MTVVEQQRGFMLNVVLMGAIALVGGMLLIEGVDDLGSRFRDGPVIIPGLCLVLLVGIAGLAKRGRYIASSSCVIGLFMALGTYFLAHWSIDASQGILLYALVVAVAGILLGTRAAIVMTITAAISMGLLVLGQQYRLIVPDTAWMQDPPPAIDLVLSALSLSLIATLSWLANRETARSLRRAQASEMALAAERDQLELTVAHRTGELQRFAELGRLSAGLLHDMANPLAVASLGLQELGETGRSQLVDEIAHSLRHIERYLESGRRQLQHQSEPQRFAVIGEIHQAVNLLAHKARAASVKIEVPQTCSCQLYGDRVKFHQLITNLIANAVEAYENASTRNRRVQVKIFRRADYLEVMVQDWGAGIQAAEQEVIFEPFYTAKRTTNGGIGIGLATVRRIAEIDFRGSVAVRSSPTRETCFVVQLRDSEEAAYPYNHQLAPLQ